MRSTGILILIFLVLGCYAKFDRSASMKAANEHVSAIMDAVKVKDQSAIKKLIQVDSNDTQNLGYFIDRMQDMQLKIESKYSSGDESSINANVQLANMIPGRFGLRKSTDSKTGWRIESMTFNKYTDPTANVDYHHQPTWYCGKEMLRCVIDALDDWNPTDEERIVKNQIGVFLSVRRNKDPSKIKSLFNSTENDVKNLPKFMEIFRHVYTITVQNYGGKNNIIHADVIMEFVYWHYGKGAPGREVITIPGSFILKKSSASPTGWQFTTLGIKPNPNGAKKGIKPNPIFSAPLRSSPILSYPQKIRRSKRKQKINAQKFYYTMSVPVPTPSKQNTCYWIHCTLDDFPPKTAKISSRVLIYHGTLGHGHDFPTSWGGGVLKFGKFGDPKFHRNS